MSESSAGRSPGHSPEPWEVTEVGAGEYFIVKFEPGGDGWEHSVGEIDREADARRIVACVNACKNVPTEALEVYGRAALVERVVVITREALDQMQEALAAGTLGDVLQQQEESDGQGE